MPNRPMTRDQVRHVLRLRRKLDRQFRRRKLRQLKGQHRVVWCWRCKHPLVRCQCPLMDMENWFGECKRV